MNPLEFDDSQIRELIETWLLDQLDAMSASQVSARLWAAVQAEVARADLPPVLPWLKDESGLAVDYKLPGLTKVTIRGLSLAPGMSLRAVSQHVFGFQSGQIPLGINIETYCPLQWSAKLMRDGRVVVVPRTTASYPAGTLAGIFGLEGAPRVIATLPMVPLLPLEGLAAVLMTASGAPAIVSGQVYGLPEELGTVHEALHQLAP